MLILTAFLVAMGLILIWGISVYNKQIRLRAACRNSWSQIDIQLQRRHDLIPNLVEVAKRFLAHEKDTLEAVIVARSQAVNARTQATDPTQSPLQQQQMIRAEDALSQSLGRLMMLTESYPEIKADATMSQLSEEISSTENRVAFARQAYNDSAMLHNIHRESFPQKLIVGSFKQIQLWEALDRSIEKAPKIQF
jgi:LemA protein